MWVPDGTVVKNLPDNAGGAGDVGLTAGTAILYLDIFLPLLKIKAL